MLEAVPFEQTQQAFIDPLDRARPFVDPAGVNLHSIGTGLDLLVSIFRVENTAYSNNWQCAASVTVDVRNEARHHRRNRPAAQSARLTTVGRFQSFAFERGRIGSDDPRQLLLVND